MTNIKSHNGQFVQCAWCKKIRIGEQWFSVDHPEQLPRDMSHGICPTCMKKVRAEYHKSKKTLV